jgi:hypothetical protein
VHEVSMQYVATLGYDDLDGEPLMDKYSRQQMIDFACSMSFDECLSEMNSQLVSYLNDDNVKLPVNLEASIFCYGLMASAKANNDDFHYFAQLWQIMQASQDTEYRLRIIDALGCFGNADALYDYMETMTAGTNAARYRQNEYWLVIHAAYSKTREGIEAVIRFLTRYSGTAATRTRKPNLVEEVIVDIAPRIFDDILLEKVNVVVVVVIILKLRLFSNIKAQCHDDIIERQRKRS